MDYLTAADGYKISTSYKVRRLRQAKENISELVLFFEVSEINAFFPDFFQTCRFPGQTPACGFNKERLRAQKVNELRSVH